MILVAIGANLPGPGGAAPVETCRWAARALAGLPGLSLDAVSRWFVTPPDPPSPQPDYVNGVARLSGAPEPADLLAALHRLEHAAGRRRSALNAARSLDLDLIAMGGLVRAGPDPVLPHPRAHLRRFVLLPLAEVAPGWMHPLLGRTVEALVATLPDTPIRVL